MKTKQTIYLLSALLVFALNPLRLQASHATGLQLTYTHISGYDYKFRCVLFRDCNSISAPALMYVEASSVSCGFNQTYTLNLDTSQTSQIILTCPGAITNCNGGVVPGFEKIVYEGIATLGGACPDWVFAVTEQGRYAAITTLQSPAFENIYVPAQLNNQHGDNNSPQFINDPIIFVCKDQDFHYNNGIFDPDGDSISYRLMPAKTTASTPVQYNWGYTYDQPVTSLPPVTFGDFTGDLFIHSTAAEITVFAYEVTDWKNGVIVGSVIRDVILYTITCANNYPTATGMNGSAQQILYVFPDDTVCFDVLSDDIDPNDTVTMTWNQTIPAATFVTNGNPHPTGTFCWTPTIGDVRSQPYMFTVMVNDNVCPVENACIYSYFIYVTLDSSLVFLNAQEISANSDLSIFPNPSDGIFEISAGEKISRVTVFDSFGKCILKSKSARFDLSNQRKGIYYAEVLMHDGKMKYHKIIRQ
jgi:hypothetical protein